MAGPLPREPRFVQLPLAAREARRAELAQGLLAPSARVHPKHFYDALGSRLFDAITELPEYYLTRTEAEIMAAHGAAVALACGAGRTLVDLGAGNCAKAAALLGSLRPRRYVAVDISAAFLRQSLAGLQREHPQLEMLGLGMDFSERLELPGEVGEGPRTLFYAGSSIGNFSPGQALAFLRQAHAACAGGALLIGVDLVKPAALLEAAYDDPLGVTAAFNLNLLRHVNGLLGSDFDVRQWRHQARYQAQGGADGDPQGARIQMHLVAREALTVRWPGGERAFAAGEALHTENSYKYRADDFAALLRDAGFRGLQRFSDPRGWFAVFVAQA